MTAVSTGGFREAQEGEQSRADNRRGKRRGVWVSTIRVGGRNTMDKDGPRHCGTGEQAHAERDRTRKVLPAWSWTELAPGAVFGGQGRRTLGRRRRTVEPGSPEPVRRSRSSRAEQRPWLLTVHSGRIADSGTSAFTAPRTRKAIARSRLCSSPNGAAGRPSRLF